MTMGSENRLGGERSMLPRVTTHTLKIAGAILTALYFFGAAVIQNGVLRAPDYTPEQLNDLLAGDAGAMLWAGVASVAEIVGMIAISIYAYLLAQGVEHTSSMKRYALSVLAFALISEVPYDLAVYGRAWDWDSQNPLWTVLAALVTLWIMQSVEGRRHACPLCAVAAVGGCLWAELLRCKFGWGFALIASALYLLRRRRTMSLVAGLGVSLVYLTAAMGFILISMCDGEKRTVENRLAKYGFYIYYPLLLALMAAWVWMARQSG